MTVGLPCEGFLKYQKARSGHECLLPTAHAHTCSKDPRTGTNHSTVTQQGNKHVLRLAFVEGNASSCTVGQWLHGGEAPGGKSFPRVLAWYNSVRVLNVKVQWNECA